jgi:DNA replication and repair protein RecF
VLAHSALLADMSGYSPLLLLDEVAAHLDPGRRRALYDALTDLGAQVFMTGADPLAFSEIEDRAQIFEVSPGQIRPRNG